MFYTQEKKIRMSFNIPHPDVNETGDMNFDEINQYKKEICPDMDSDPLTWWRLHQQLYPKLAVLAQKYLSPPATTVPCERLFSLAGFIADKRRAALLPESLNMLLCLKNWLSDDEE